MKTDIRSLIYVKSHTIGVKFHFITIIAKYKVFLFSNF